MARPLVYLASLLVLAACGGSRASSDNDTTGVATGGPMVPVTPCEPSECGEPIDAPRRACSDGTFAGSTGRCVRTSESGCGWEILACRGEPNEIPVVPTSSEPTSEAESMMGERCGSRGLPECPAGQFCDFEAGSQCGADDRGGRCRSRPEMCTQEYDPVCGCDGRTHSNACNAASQGVSVAHRGEC